MGKRVAKSEIDQIDKIEKSLTRSVNRRESAKVRMKNRNKATASKPQNTSKEHRRTRHPVFVAASISAAVATCLFLLYKYYVGSTFDFLKSISKDKGTETSETATDAPKEEKPNFGDKPIVIYISGSDSRGSVSDQNARSDVNIVAIVNPTTGKILLVSIPRDYYVQLHGTAGLRDKLTHAGIYGVDMSRQTIEDLLNIKVDYTVKVGFDALKTIVDAIGGIDIYSDQDLTPHTDKTCHFIVGTQHVNGTCALAFSRERYAYATGDRHRGENQQQVISKIIEKVTSPAYLLKFPEILRAADGLFETSFTYSEILDMLKFQLLSGPNWQTESISLSGTGSMRPTYSIPSQSLYVMIPDDASIVSAKEKIAQSLKTAEQLKAEAEEKARQEAEAKAQQEVDE
ncbi:LCP family protein [Candidatus Saccharibacteria bacterium]|nr:LCP family protein [Candidatus Saccharibacteria bacterium]